MADHFTVAFHFPNNKVVINWLSEEDAAHLAGKVVHGVPFSVKQGYDPHWTQPTNPESYVINPALVTYVETRAQLPF